jgi:serine/threonine protein kinase
MTGQHTLESLTEKRRPLPLDRVVEIVKDVAVVLDRVHAQGRVHGGLTPNHILIDDDWHATFVANDRWQILGDTLVSVRAYYAPEQWRGQKVDGRADQYALAVIVYELLTGHRRLDSAVLGGIQTLQPVEVFADVPLQPCAGLHVNAALRRALSARAAHRFPTVGAFARALVAPPPVPPLWRRAVWRLVPPVAIAALAIALALALIRVARIVHLPPL